MKSGGGVSTRKARSDKKRDVKPTIPIELKDTIYRLSYITNTPVKNVCEELCKEVLNDERVLEYLSRYFKRDLHWGKTIYFGSAENPTVVKKLNVKCERIKIRFDEQNHTSLAALSFALDCSISRVAAILLEISMKNMRFVNSYMRKYLDNQLSENQIRDLQNILKFVNKGNEVQHSWLTLITYIVEEVNAPINRIRDAIKEFLNKED